jgi:hypothetical protein
MSTDRQKFRGHRSSATQRGIPFLLTFQEWLVWWEAFSPNWRELRGQGRGKYHMSRRGDKGPYALGNIEPKLHEVNAAESRRQTVPRGEGHKLAKLTDERVLQVRADDRSLRTIAKELGVSKRLILSVRQRKAWAHVH